MKRFVILHNIRSTHNVGSVFRTADGAGVSHVYLTGYTPAPIDRFGRVDDSIRKTALGATEFIPWSSVPDIFSLIEELKQQNVDIVVVEQDPRAHSYLDWKPVRDTIFIFGNEIEGVPKEVCDAADAILHIPMHGKKESLNVSVSAGVVLFHAAGIASTQ